MVGQIWLNILILSVHESIDYKLVATCDVAKCKWRDMCQMFSEKRPDVFFCNKEAT